MIIDYEVKTEQNIGLGRSDILVTPKENKENSFVFELKYIKEESEEKLQSLANEALKQIKEKEYYKDMLKKGLKKVTLYEFAFSKNKLKAVSVAISNRKS
ncbi:MAG: PD-(D/E)XK nuclease domain-containing protein [Firmicutes bacterium]|uniref:PD-(D/E)XK nuclease domain-containing protein n=1 Tax=Candidatus Onthovivens merdipullorum TaxID=2840889 RepID=A0A9D9DGI3_9BACL|nr:PD-(D/E)XK nuclease domain-containing protein [Candidatus Onthovivens merdipullorum]